MLAWASNNGLLHMDVGQDWGKICKNWAGQDMGNKGRRVRSGAQGDTCYQRPGISKRNSGYWSGNEAAGAPRNSIDARRADCRPATALHHQLPNVPTPFLLPLHLPRTGYFHETDSAAHRHMMDLNYMGVVHVVKAVLPGMIKQRQGHLIVVASTLSLMGEVTIPYYIIVSSTHCRYNQIYPHVRYAIECIFPGRGP